MRNHHYENLVKALIEKNILILQFSTSDIEIKPIIIKTLFFIDYKTGMSTMVSANEGNIRYKIREVFENHEEYYLLFWNYSENYGYESLDLGFSTKEIRTLYEKTIDFSLALEMYANKTSQKLLDKVPNVHKGDFDLKYYIALLNEIPIDDNWLTGVIEKDINDYERLRKSTEIKGKMIEKFINIIESPGKTLKVSKNESFISKTIEKTLKKKKRVFIVHGRDGILKEKFENFLSKLRLETVDFMKAKSELAMGSPYIWDIIEHGFEMAQCGVILLTPDEVASLNPSFCTSDDDLKLKTRARPNVIFEGGYSFGIHKNRTILIEFGGIDAFSDYSGRHVIRYKETVASKKEIANQLKGCGCSISQSIISSITNRIKINPDKFSIFDHLKTIDQQLHS